MLRNDETNIGGLRSYIDVLLVNRAQGDLLGKNISIIAKCMFHKNVVVIGVNFCEIIRVNVYGHCSDDLRQLRRRKQPPCECGPATISGNGSNTYRPSHSLTKLIIRIQCHFCPYITLLTVQHIIG
jgi:hypothetical protein